MSIAICFVAKTGVVLGTDSRVTTTFQEGKTREDAYPKLVSFGDLPIALAMVGAGAYGGRDFRSLVAETHRTWLGRRKRSRTVDEVAQAFADTAAPIAKESGREDAMRVFVAGYSPGVPFGELWEVDLPAGTIRREVEPGRNTIRWRGSNEAVTTLWWGANLHALRHAMADAGVPRGKHQAVVDNVTARCGWGPERLNWGMPLNSAVDLVRFQLEVQIQYERFTPGRGFCGPPTQIVAINDSGLHWMDNPFCRLGAVGG